MAIPINNLPGVGRVADAGAGAPAGFKPITGPSFADTLKESIGEVSKLQQDATSAVENLAAGRTDDVTGVMTAVEKSDLAFKTLLSIRAKLMDAYDEIKNMPI